MLKCIYEYVMRCWVNTGEYVYVVWDCSFCNYCLPITFFVWNKFIHSFYQKSLTLDFWIKYREKRKNTHQNKNTALKAYWKNKINKQLAKAYIIYVPEHFFCPHLNTPETLIPFIKKEKIHLASERKEILFSKPLCWWIYLLGGLKIPHRSV